MLSVISEQIEQLKRQKKECERSLKKERQKIEKNKTTVKILTDNSQRKKDEINRILKEKNDDKHTLEEYLKVVCESYQNQRTNVINSINAVTTVPEDKFLYMLFLCSLEKDYEKVVGGINGK